ncbi:MAG: hypothetical protein P4L11_00470 [Geothrix sp.]|nr:hypothetical protein [Geothrix sp.]
MNKSISSMAFAFGAVAAVVAPAQEPALTPELQRWAGDQGATRGFDATHLKGFLAARRADLTAGASGVWLPWLTGLSQGTSTNLSLWALARRAEAGDSSAYRPYQEALLLHLKGLTVRRSGKVRFVAFDPPRTEAFDLPGTFQPDPSSPLWTWFFNRISARKDMLVTPADYALWCYNTAPSQRQLILDLAAHVQDLPDKEAYDPGVLQGRRPSAWQDPRYWVVLDWLFSWGREADWQTAMDGIPMKDQPYFQVIFNALKNSTRSFNGSLEASRGADNRLNPLWTEPGDVFSHKWTQWTGSRLGFQLQRPDPFMLPAPRIPVRFMTVLRSEVTFGRDGKVSFVRPLPGPWVCVHALQEMHNLSRWTIKGGSENPTVIQVSRPILPRWPDVTDLHDTYDYQWIVVRPRS